MKLLHDYILVTVDVEEETESGIILSTKHVPDTGVVIATGDGKFDYGKWIHNDVEKGDKVQFTPGAGHLIKIKGKEYLLLRNSDVICVL